MSSRSASFGSAIGRLRWRELGLLLPASAVLLLGASILLIQQGTELTTLALLPAIGVALLFLLAHFWLIARLPHADQTILPLAAMLTGIGLTMVTRIEPTLAPRQLAWLVVALILWAIVIAFPRRVGWLARYRYTWALLGIALLASTMVFGIDPNASGVRIWLGVGGYYFQPSELIKILLVAFLAAYLDEVRELIGGVDQPRGRVLAPSVAHLLPIAVMTGVSLLLMLAQRDLGPALLFFAVTLAMLYQATGRFLYVVLGGLTFLVGAFAAYRVFSVARLRIDIWLDPWSDPAGSGYQVVQALVAFASGGVVGTGLGYGHPEILPAAYTDFPFAVFAEEFGLIGASALLGVYLVFILRGYAIAARASDPFAALLAGGLVSVIAIQTFIIIGGNLKLLPLTGITLPFISYGGSSLVTNFIVIGLLHRISAEPTAND